MKRRPMLPPIGMLPYVALLAGLAGGCDTGPMNDGGPISSASLTPTTNLVCPMTGKVVAPGAPLRFFEGKTIGFCSGFCPASWDRLSDARKKTRLAGAMNRQESMVANSRCPMTGNMIDKTAPMRVYDGKIVAFCCDKCPALWDALPDAEKKTKLSAAMR